MTWTPRDDVPCPNCGAPSRKLCDARDRLHHVPGKFALWECSGCGVIHLDPRLDWAGMSAYYPPAYNLGAKRQPLLPAMGERRRRLLMRSIRPKHSLILQHGGRGRLLDIGCNLGHFLFGMQLLGWRELFGAEVSAEAAELAAASLGRPVWKSAFPEEVPPGGPFDVVTMWHVFEHLPDPARALEKLRELVDPSGICVINIPDPTGLDCRLFGAAWTGFDAPRHYFTYPPHTFRRLVADAGFDMVGEAYVDEALGSAILGMSFFLEGSRLLPAWGRIARVLSTGPAGLALAPVFRGLAALGWKGSRAYVLKVHPLP